MAGKRGRPSKFTPELAEEICERLGKGESLLSICDDERMPADRTIREWVENNAEFSAEYAQARARGYDAIALDALAIADNGFNDKGTDDEGNVKIDYDHISRSKLRVETRLKLLACWDPKRYGTQRHEVEHAGAVELTADKALERLESSLSKALEQLGL